jgi:hypothetical protein
LVTARREEPTVAIVVLNLEVDDYEAWKSMFDEDPAGRKAAGATSHMVSRAIDDSNDVFIRVEFPSNDQAKAFRQRLLDSGVLDRAGTRVKMGPVAAEVAETVNY